MKRLLSVFIFLVLAQGLAQPTSLTALASFGQLREMLRNRIEVAGVPARIHIGEEPIYASVALPRFYEGRSYEPAWVGMKGPLPQVDTLTKAIREADREGLRPEDYHLVRIEATLGEIREGKEQKKAINLRRLVDLDLLLTDAFLIYASHLLGGRVNPETIDGEWQASRRELDLVEILQRAIASNQIERELQSLVPSQPGYARLREALAQYREVSAKGGGPTVPEGPKIQIGDRGQRVSILRSRLIVLGDLPSEKDADGDLFDEALEWAVRRFQQRLGLDVDGVVGPSTLKALNVSVEERIRRIRVNLERWRWLPQDLGQKYILVNIARFQLDVVENGQSLMSMRVVVGTSYRRTPVFSDEMTYLVLNPYWHIPHKIAVEDKLPLIRKDPNYLREQHIRVFQGWGTDTTEIDPETIDWAQITATNFPFRLRQDPGPWNALGKVKFMFPNKFNVYLHDTPSKELFEKTSRTLSSGCIRVEKPMDLAEYVLMGDAKWTRETLLAAMNQNTEQTVRLPEPIRVYLLYWTVWVDEDGSIQFRSDVYGRDDILDSALRKPSPTS